MSPGLVKIRALIVSAGMRRLPLTTISEMTSFCPQPTFPKTSNRDTSASQKRAAPGLSLRQDNRNKGDDTDVAHLLLARFGTTGFSG